MKVNKKSKAYLFAKEKHKGQISKYNKALQILSGV